MKYKEINETLTRMREALEDVTKVGLSDEERIEKGGVLKAEVGKLEETIKGDEKEYLSILEKYQQAVMSLGTDKKGEEDVDPQPQKYDLDTFMDNFLKTKGE